MASLKSLRRQLATLSVRTSTHRRGRVPPRDPVSIMPAAFSRGTRVTRAPDSRTLSGTAFLTTVTGSPTAPFGLITVNPVYWPKSFVSQMAALYSQYLPLKIEVEYRPNVGTAAAGRVIFGTKWHNDMPNPEDELLSTPGGYSAPLWQPWRVNIPLTGMSRRLYEVDTPISPDSSPFSLCWYCATQGVAGDLFVHYSFRLMNQNPTPSTFETGVATASTTINTGVGAVLETLATMSTSSVPWVKKLVPGGSLLRQTLDLTSRVARWLYRGEAVAQATQGSSQTNSSGTGLVPNTPTVFVRYYILQEPSSVLAAAAASSVETKQLVTERPGFLSEARMEAPSFTSECLGTRSESTPPLGILPSGPCGPPSTASTSSQESSKSMIQDGEESITLAEDSHSLKSPGMESA